MSGEPVGDFYVHLLQRQQVSKEMTSSTKLLRLSNGKRPSVIHFYNGGWGGCRPCAAQMESWACTIPQVQFICVCVDDSGRVVAQQFDRMFGFEYALNGYIPSRSYMPQGYGQLGCSGFIISDQNGNFVSRQTPPYLQYGDQAFRMVEKILRSLVGPSFGSSDDKAILPQASAPLLTKQDFSVPDIGIDCMDEEHERCDKSLAAMLKRPTISSLRHVLEEIQHHFAHEEGLLMMHGFGGKPDNPFSAIHSHIKDHKRILEMVGSAISTGEECAGGSWHQPVDTVVDRTVATGIAQAFHDHATKFDALYAEHIPADAK